MIKFILFSIRILSKTIFIYLLCFSVQSFAEKDELAGGSSKDTQNYKSKRNCSLLMDWVNSDLQDKPFNIGFSNASRKCLAESKKAHDKLIGNKTNAIIETKDLGSYYSQKFKNKISDNNQEKYLSACHETVSDETKRRSLQTRFYTASAKMETANSTIVDEIAYYDSVLPSPYDSVLMGIDCKTAFLEINKKCDEYKKQAKDCKSGTTTRFGNLVKKTNENLYRINELEKAHRLCLTKTRFKYKGDSPPSTQTNDKCRPFFQAIEVLKDLTPWVRGEVFNSIAIKAKPSYSNNYQTKFDEKKITQAISDQLHKNRQALVRTFNTNTNNFQCMINNNVDDPECDFKKIRSQVASQPDIKASNIFSTNSLQDQEAAIQMESDQCLMKYEDDLYQLHNTIKDVGYTVVLTAATLGVGWASGLKAINSVSKLGRSLAIANGTFGAAASGVDLKDTYKECSQESKLVIDLSTKENLTKENMCSSESSPVSQAQEKETNCILSALLTAPGILPFLGSTPGLMKLTTVNRSAKSAANTPTVVNSPPKNALIPVRRSARSTENVSEEILQHNASEMNRLARKEPDKAKALIKNQMKASGTEVTDEQADAILQAHLKYECDIGDCTPKQLIGKTRLMKEVGLNEDQRRAAIERGLAGNSELKISNDSELLELITPYKSNLDEMDLGEIKSAVKYLEAEEVASGKKLNSHDKNLLKKLKFAQLRKEYQAEKAAKEVRIRNESGIGAPLTSEQSERISKLTSILENGKANQLTPAVVKEINEITSYLYKKRFWYNKKHDIGGLVKADEGKVQRFANAVDKAVEQNSYGSSNADKLAKEQNRIPALPTVEKNFPQFNGTIKRETVISASGARNASPDGKKITSTLKLVNSTTNNLPKLEGFVRYQPVITKEGEFSDLAKKLKPHGIDPDELRDANIASTLNLQGLEQNKDYTKNTFELVEKIKELKTLDKWSDVERSLNSDERKLINNLFNVADDHYLNFRGDHIHSLKKFDESH